MNGTIEIAKANYGDTISKENPEAPAGYVFTGWDQNTVTGDMIVNAKYSEESYTVTFMNPVVGTEEESVCEVKTVAYGKSAIPPDVQYMTAPEGTKITGWSTDFAWWCVTEDMVVYPVLEYDETASAPYTNTDLDSFVTVSEDEVTDEDAVIETPTVTLISDTQDAMIYYTTDGSEPSMETYHYEEAAEEEAAVLLADVGEETDEEPILVNSTKLYTGPIEVTGNMTIKAYAVVDGMNISDLSEIEVKFETGEDVESFENTDESVIEGKDFIEPASVQISKTSATLTVGETATLTASVLPENAMEKSVTWTSSDSSVATVSNTGKVTAVKKGTCTITVASVDDASVKATCTITVNDPAATTTPSTSTETVPDTGTSDSTIDSTESTDSSTESTETVTTTTVKLKKPTSVKAKKSGKKAIKITWKKVSKATRYEIYRATKKKGKYKKIKTIKKGSTVSYKDTKVKKGKTYYYKVRAVRISNKVTIKSTFSKVVKCKR